jgi:tRNA-specific 2-thiouridylase
LFSDSLDASTVHWIAGAPPKREFRSMAKVRYRQADQPCSVAVDDANQVRVTFDHPQRAVTPGQFVVFYSNDECLGSGVIASTQTATAHLKEHIANTGS